MRHPKPTPRSPRFRKSRAGHEPEGKEGEAKLAVVSLQLAAEAKSEWICFAVHSGDSFIKKWQVAGIRKQNFRLEVIYCEGNGSIPG